MNIESIIFGSVLFLVIFMISKKMYKDHKSGKKSCGGCSGCSSCDQNLHKH